MGDSPAKKLNFEPIGKENKLFATPDSDSLDDLKKPSVDVVKKDVKPTVAPTIKEMEADEPLLQENPHRFVLFPIKYHEVCHQRVTRLMVKSTLANTRPVDLANVQKGRGLFLDGRGDRPVKGHARLEQPT